MPRMSCDHYLISGNRASAFGIAGENHPDAPDNSTLNAYSKGELRFI